MATNRILQRYILEALENSKTGVLDFNEKSFPDFHIHSGEKIHDEQGIINHAAVRELQHLMEKGLIRSETPVRHKNSRILEITADGRDYLEPDGGLTAELNVVTIKFSEETIKKIVEDCISGSSLTSSEKESKTKALLNLTGDSLKTALQELIKIGVHAAVKSGLPF
ncbi:hypothetical protein DA2_1494 [Desulfovibrio sp. A2]|nr:hypothetical protein DA2_1494 [Desulfovibrio sp. A2]